jgi:folate-binding protein YgfZ
MYLNLSNRALIKVSGTDAESFLQAQFSNDIGLLRSDEVQLSAYCQHQGKIIALFWVMRSEESFLLSFPTDLAEKVITRLQMFIIMSDVLIEDISNQYSQIGLINENDSSTYSINENLSLLIASNLEKNIEMSSNNDEWIKSCIDSQIPEVFLSTSEKLVPQMLNLDINEVGVNFSKGCYPGQEVVARLHYLGEAKRRLFAFQSDSKVQIGDNLYCASSKAAKARGDRYKGSGLVVNTVKYYSKFYCLATLDVDLKDKKITINNESGQILTRINNE